MVEDMTAAPPLEPINMVGVFDLPDDGLVSSLALTPDGCYVFAAFGGGEVRVYAQALGTVGAASRSGTIVAQIKSKGMFSNTKVDCHVEASEDGRFVFAGLLRGSSELVALDITELPRWGTLPTREELSLAPSRFDLNKLIRPYAHLDGKLKGFGAVAAVRRGPDRSEWGKEYRLFCGRGIKNIHVWSFKPRSKARARVSGGGEAGGAGGGDSSLWDGEWTCLYDTSTNGATVELVAFRNGGLEGISKSNDVNVRVWDLSNEDRRTKPSFRDISNSKDTRVVFGDYAYGGTTELSLVKLDAPAVENHTEIALPDAGVRSPLAGRSSPLAGRSPPSARSKRHCRMLKDLAGTQDGRHVVLVCSDGTVLYHRHTQAANTKCLEPLEGVGVDEDDARPTVALSLAGRAGLPVLMIAGGRGRGVATKGGQERRKELVLKALPRSDAQQLEDSQVKRLDSLGRPLLAWPEGRRLTPKDRKMDFDSYDGVGRNAGRGGHDQGEVIRYDTMHGNEGTVTAKVESGGEATIASSAAIVYASKPVAVVQSFAPDAPAATQSPATPAAPSTPVPLHYQQIRPAATATFPLQRLESKPDASSPLPTDPQRSASPSPSSSGIGPSHFFTPVSSGRKRAVRHDGGKATAPGSSPPARSPVGSSPGGSGSRVGRKKRGPAGASGHGRPRAGSMASLGSSQAQAGPTGDASSTESRVLGTGGGGVALDVVGEKDASSGGGDNGGVHDPAEMNPRQGSIGTGTDVAVGDGSTEDNKTDDVRGGEGLGNSGVSGGGSSETLAVGEEKDTTATVGKNENAPDVLARAADVEATLEDGGAGGGGRDGAGGGGVGERKRRGSVSGASTGKGASVGRRPGKKRTREDHEKGAGDESGLEEGETTAAPLKRGRRGAGSGAEEGGPSSRGVGGKARRTNSHVTDDDGGGGPGGGDQVLLRDRRSRIAARVLRSSGNVFDIGAIVRGITTRMTEAEQPEELRVVRVAERDVVVDPPAVPAGLLKFLVEREERRDREERNSVQNRAACVFCQSTGTAVVRYHSPLDTLWAESSAILQSTPVSLERARALYNAGLKLLPHSPSTHAAADGDGGGDLGNSLVSEVGKKRGAEKNSTRVTREEGDSPPQSRNPHDVVSQPLGTEAVERQGSVGVAHGLNLDDQGRRTALGVAVPAGNGTKVKGFEEGHGELRPASAHEIPAPDPPPKSALSCGDTHGNIKPDFAEGADARSTHEGSRGSRQAGRRSVEEDRFARSAPAALQWDRTHSPSVTPACSVRSPAGATATDGKSGVPTGGAWGAVASLAVVAGVEASVSRKESKPAPKEAKTLHLGEATSPSSSRASAWETRYVRPAAGKGTTSNAFAMEDAPSVEGGERKLATAPSARAVVATAKNPTASCRDAQALDVDMELEVEVDSEVDVVDDSGDDQQAEVHVGEDSAAVAGSSASAISRQDDRDRAAAAVAASFAAAAAASTCDEPGGLSASVAAGRETAFTAQTLSGKVGPSSSSEEGATTGSVDVESVDATAKVAALAEGRNGPKKDDVGKGKPDAPGSRAVETPVAGSSYHAAATAATASTSSWSAHKSPKRGVKSTASATPAEAAAAVSMGPSVFPPPQESVINMGRVEGVRGSGGGVIDRVYGEHCLEREAVARAFFDEQDALRRRFLEAVDLVELDKAVECAGLELRNGCRAAQTLKARLKTRWREQTVLPVGGGGLSACTAREAHQATLRWQEQIRAIISDYKELLRDLLGRQRLEAGALQMAQEMELSKGKAPPLTVRFAFPRIFDEVAQRHGIKLPL